MKAVLSRRYESDQTFGQLVIFDGDVIVYKCLTLELPWNNNQLRSSCIPESKYKVHKIYSPKFGQCFHLQDVLDRSGILIHVGNFASLTEQSDTTGCILPGTAFMDINSDGNVDIIQSRATMNKLLNFLPDSFYLYII